MPASRLQGLLVTASAVASTFAAGAEAVAQSSTAASRSARAVSQTPNNGPSRFLGRWELDLTRMPSTYGTRPKRVLYTFNDVGSGKWLTTIDITGQDGSVRHMAVRYMRDGSAAASEGDTVEADSAAFNSPAPNVLVMCIGKEKTLGSVRVYAVSADGNELTESAADVNDAGAPFVRNFHYKRVG